MDAVTDAVPDAVPALPLLMRSWWILALRGVIAVVFGLFALMLPGLTLLALIALFSVYALLAGAVAVTGALRSRKYAPDWGLVLALGLVSIVAGVLAAVRPALTALVLVVVIGLNAVVTGLIDVVLALRLRHHLQGSEWLLLLSAVASILFGAILLALPDAGALALVWLISVYAIVVGLLYVAMAYRAYAVQHRPEHVKMVPVTAAAAQNDRRVGERRGNSPVHS